MKASIILFAALVANFIQAKIYIDQEKDPFPLVDVQIIVPTGVLSEDPVTGPAAYLLSDIWEPASMTLTNEKFVDALGAYGASIDISLYSQYSFINFSFLWSKDKDYTKLTKLFKDFWQNPRLTESELSKAKVKAKAGFLSALNSDQSLMIMTLKRWLNKNFFNAEMLYADNISQIKLSDVKKFHQDRLLKTSDVWVGVVAPDKTMPDVKKMISAMFSQQGEMVTDVIKKKLKVKIPKVVSNKGVEKTFIFIEKPDLNQTITSFVSFIPEEAGFENELASDFGTTLLFNAGMSAIFFDEIREKRGLAYTVSSLWRNYVGFPMVSFMMNPVREKTDEAFTVVKDLIQKSFVKGDLYKNLEKERWQGFWTGYVNKKMLSSSTPSSRLSKRSDVALGVSSYKMATSSPHKWKIKRSHLKDYYTDAWKRGYKIAVAVGDANELMELVAKHFSDYKVVKIPYKKAVSRNTYHR